MTDLKNIWFAEYSVSQNAFHVESLERCIEHGRNIAFSGEIVDFNVIGAFSSRAQANKFIDMLIEKYDKFNGCKA